MVKAPKAPFTTRGMSLHQATACGAVPAAPSSRLHHVGDEDETHHWEQMRWKERTFLALIGVGHVGAVPRFTVVNKQ